MRNKLHHRLTPALLGMALSLMISCSDRSLTLELQVERFEQPKQIKIDVLWVVDNSLSMKEETVLVQDGSAEFVQALVDSNADFHLGLATMNIEKQTGGAPEQAGKLQIPPTLLTIDTATESRRYLATGQGSSADIVEDFKDILNYAQTDVDVGTDPVLGSNVNGKGCEAGLESARLAVDTTLAQNPGFLRDDAALAVVFLTDEDDASTTAGRNADDDCGPTTFPKSLDEVGEYVTYFNTLKEGKFAFHGILTLENDTTCTTAEEESLEFLEAIEAVGGFARSICTADYTTFLDDLGVQIAQLASKYALKLLIDPSTLVVKVNGVTLASSEYTIDATGKGVILDNTPPIGADVEFSYYALTSSLSLFN